MSITSSVTQQKNRKKWTRWAVEIGIFIAIFLGISAYQTRHLMPRGERAPDWVLTDLQGNRHTLTDYHDKPVLLYFWAPWCTACHLTSSNISAIQRRVGDNVHILSIVLSYEDTAQVQKHVESKNIDYPVLLGMDSLYHTYRVESFPTIYMLTKDGLIRHNLVGYTTQLGLHWRLWWL